MNPRAERITSMILIGWVLASSTAAASLQDVMVKSSYPACDGVQMVESALSPQQKMEFIVTGRAQGIQRLPKSEFISGISDPQSIASSIRLLRLVAAKKLEHLNEHIDYYSDLERCLIKAPVAKDVDCASLVGDFNQALTAAVPELRRELAVSMNANPLDTPISLPSAHINHLMQGIPGFANPAGATALTRAELAQAEQDFMRDREEVLQQVDADIKLQRERNRDSYIFNSLSDLHVEMLKQAYRSRAAVHKGKYAKILLANPILSYLPAGSIANGRAPEKAVALKAIHELLKVVQKEAASVQRTAEQNCLEFERFNGEAMWKAYVKGDIEPLQFITSPLLNDVLRSHREYCAIAEQLSRRLAVRDMQNAVVITVMFGVGTGTGVIAFGLVGNSTKLLFTLVQSMGYARSVSVLTALQAVERTSFAIRFAAGAMEAYHHRAHKRAEAIAETTLKLAP